MVCLVALSLTDTPVLHCTLARGCSPQPPGRGALAQEVLLMATRRFGELFKSWKILRGDKERSPGVLGRPGR